MQYENFHTIPCQIKLKNEDQEGIITKEGVTAFLCTPTNNDTTEQTHLSSDELNLQFIVEQVQRYPNTQIFAITAQQTIELIINEQGLIIPKT